MDTLYLRDSYIMYLYTNIRRHEWYESLNWITQRILLENKIKDYCAICMYVHNMLKDFVFIIVYSKFSIIIELEEFDENL